MQQCCKTSWKKNFACVQCVTGPYFQSVTNVWFGEPEPQAYFCEPQTVFLQVCELELQGCFCEEPLFFSFFLVFFSFNLALTFYSVNATLGRKKQKVFSFLSFFHVWNSVSNLISLNRFWRSVKLHSFCNKMLIT